MADPHYGVNDWRTIPFAPDYAVNCEGRIKRTALHPRHRRGRELKPASNQQGYPSVVLYVEGVKLYLSVHQIVCRVFHGDRPKGKHEVGHRDGNPANPHASNLRWVTKAENYADRNQHGTHNRGVRNGAAKLDPLKLQALHILSERMPSRKVAAVLGISKSQVGNILRGEAWADNPSRRIGVTDEVPARSGQSVKS